MNDNMLPLSVDEACGLAEAASENLRETTNELGIVAVVNMDKDEVISVLQSVEKDLEDMARYLRFLREGLLNGYIRRASPVWEDLKQWKEDAEEVVNQ